ncbi:227_t:CDS:2 [Entrophospora sp. SA101]|nr:227_t:CDS:2 [Entrophospora sp. SA101]
MKRRNLGVSHDASKLTKKRFKTKELHVIDSDVDANDSLMGTSSKINNNNNRYTLG